MGATVRFVALTALRDRLFNGLLGMLVLVVSISFFLGDTALTEKSEMALVFAAGAGRVVIAMGLTIFIAFHVQRMFETREVEAILSRALSRETFVIAYWLGFASLAAFFVALFGIALAITAPSPSGAGLWAATLFLETLVVAAVAIFAGMMLERATSTVMFTFGFYAFARLIGFFVGIADGLPGFSEISAFDRLMQFFAYLIPRFDLFAQTQWVVYGKAGGGDLVAAGLQAGVFLLVVLTAAVLDFRRKQF